MNFGLSQSEFEILQQLIIKPLRTLSAQVWIFGSRARDENKKFSDIDILYELPSNTRLPSGFLSNIKENIEESRFPYKVDLVERSEVAESYREQVETEKIELIG